jgi:L-iditol 2-dehydrogenase
MKVAVLVSPRKIEIQDRPIPEPGPGQARIKLASVGVCGSDVHYFYEGCIGSAVVQYPTVLGHEPSGVIDAVGDGVGLKVGTRVAIEPASPCMHCEHCLAGRHNICPNVQFLGTPPIEGIYQQYYCMPAHCCIPIPDNISLVDAAMLEPFGVGLHAVELSGLRVGETVAIFGAGPIGLVTLISAKLAGAGKVYMTDIIPERLEMAKKLGADEVMNARSGDVVKWIKDLTGGRGVDVTFEAAGQQETVTQTCVCARIGGRGYIIGIPSVPEFTIPMHECRRRELILQQVRRSNNETLRALPLVEKGDINLTPLATHFFTLDQVPEALDLVHNYKDGVIRAVIQPNDDLKDA